MDEYDNSLLIILWEYLQCFLKIGHAMVVVGDLSTGIFLVGRHNRSLQ